MQPRKRGKNESRSKGASVSLRCRSGPARSRTESSPLPCSGRHLACRGKIGITERPETKLRPNRHMNPPAIFNFAFLIATAITNFALENPNQTTTPPPNYAVVLHYGKETALTQEKAQLLYSKAVELLASSNFNSRAPRWDWSISKIHAEYRQTVSGKYLLVSFKTSRKIVTVEGEVSVREIVIGLNRPDSIAIVGGVSYADYASSLFTIDDEGRVVGHAKYSGPLCIELLKVVKKIANDG